MSPRRPPAAAPSVPVDDDRFRRAHLATATIETPEGLVEIDLKESPLRWLASRKDASGVPFLSPHEVAAGERFRCDFTLAGLSPKLGSAWQAPVSRGSDGGRGLDYADVVIAAKQRLQRAEIAVGPDFAALLLDVCGFLKGIEEVEKARGWPVRTGKVVLKLALAALARSYGLTGEAVGPARSAGIRSWRSAKTGERKSG
jgi:hypothetical protein